MSARFSLLVPLFAAACSVDSPPIEVLPDGAPDGAVAAVSFAQVVSEVVAPSCSSVGSCHQQGTQSWHEYHNLVGATAATTFCLDMPRTLVIPGDAEASLFFQKMNPDPPCGSPMPIVGTLTPDQIELVRIWIDSGARK